MKKWLRTFVIACAACVAGVLAALWAMNGFAGLGIDFAGTLALILGVTATVALGIALIKSGPAKMALGFAQRAEWAC